MMQILMDTGPWVALIDKSEGRHGDCVKWFSRYRGDIFSTEAVLTEVLYLLNFSFKARSAALDFVLERAITLIPASLDSLQYIKRIMKKYQDLPMDFADATLVSMARDWGIFHIATLDGKDFGIYRVGKDTFSNVLA